MADHSTLRPDPSKPDASTKPEGWATPGNAPLGINIPDAKADFTDLAAKFAASGGAGLSAELSADLALEVVLNEIVNQACLATNATGAAIALKRDRELVCRA